MIKLTITNKVTIYYLIGTRFNKVYVCNRSLFSLLKLKWPKNKNFYDGINFLFHP